MVDAGWPETIQGARVYEAEAVLFYYLSNYSRFNNETISLKMKIF